MRNFLMAAGDSSWRRASPMAKWASLTRSRMLTLLAAVLTDEFRARLENLRTNLPATRASCLVSSRQGSRRRLWKDCG